MLVPSIILIFYFISGLLAQNTSSSVLYLQRVPSNTPFTIKLPAQTSKTFLYKPAHNLFNSSKISLILNPLAYESQTFSLDLSLQVKVLNQKIAIKTCEDPMKKTCVLESQELEERFRNQSKIYLFFQCKELIPCHFKVSILDSKEIKLKPEESHIIHFRRTLSESFNLTVPDRKDFDRMVITVSYRRHRDLKTFSLTPQLDYDNKDKNSCIVYQELNKLILVIRNTIEMNIYNQEISLEIVARSIGLYFEVHYVVMKELSELPYDNIFYDNVDERGFVAYKTHVDNQTNEIYFNLKNHFGDKKSFFLTTESMINKLAGDPSGLTSFIDSEHPSQITNTDHEASGLLQVKNLTLDSAGYLYFIVAPSSGCFSIEISLKNQKIWPLRLGKVERRKIQNEEVQNFEIQVDNNSTEEVTIQFSSESGNSDLYLKSCKKECVLLELETLKKMDKNEFLETVTDKEHRLISFLPQCPDSQNFFGVCKYLIVIVGNSSFSLSNKFQIIVKQGGSQVLDLPENRPVSLLLEKDREYFARFWLETDPKNKKISFSISSLGASFFVSESLICLQKPNCSDQTKGDFAHPVYENLLTSDQSHHLLYYIKIQARKTTRAVFFVGVEREGIPSIINLYEGVPAIGVLDENKRTQLFSFHVDLRKNTNITLNLNCDREKLVMYVGEHHKIAKGSVFLQDFAKTYRWKSHKGVITIRTKDKHYSKKNVFYVLVAHKGDLKTHLSNEDIQVPHNYEEIPFYLMFSTEKTLKTLENNLPFYGKLAAGQTTYFKFFANPSFEELVLTKFLLRSSMNSVLHQQDLNMLVSPTPFESLDLSSLANITKLFLDEESGTLYNSFHFDQATLQQLCSLKNVNSKRFCTLYVQLQNKGQDDLLYGITVNLKGIATELFEGVETAVSITEFVGYKEKRFFYRIKNNFKGVSLWTESDFGTVYDVYVRFIDHRPKHLSVFDYKTVERSFFSSKGKSLHSIEISKDQVHQYCEIHCLLVISLMVNYTASNRTQDYYRDSELIYLLATSGMAEIQEGRHMIFELKTKEIRYFLFPLNEFLQANNSNDSLIISLTELTGKADFFISESNKSSSVLPSELQAQFYSYQSHLTIKKSSLHSKYSYAMEPKLVIAVQCSQAGKFILDVIQNNLIVLTPELPLNVLALKGEQQAFEFTNYWFYNGFQVKFSLDFGSGYVLLYKLQDKQLVDELIFDSPPLFNQSLEQSRSTVFTITPESDNQAYCWGCTYYVIIDPLEDLIGTLSLNERGGVKQILMNQAYFDSIEINDEATYKISIPIDKEIIVLLYVNSGEAQLTGGLLGPDEYYFKGEMEYDLKVESFENYQGIRVPVENLAVLWKQGNKNNNIYSQHLDLYLKISSNKNNFANYSLEVFTDGDVRVLREGVIAYTETNSSQRNMFVFEKTAKSARKNNTHLLVKSVNAGTNLNLQITAYFTENPKDFSTPKPERVPINLTLISSSTDSLEYLLPNDNKLGIFSFEMSNANKKQSLEYYVIVSSHKLIALPYDVSLSFSLPKKGAKYYETFIPRKGILALEIMQCYGAVKISRTNSYTNLMKKHGIMEQFEVLKDLEYINYYKVIKPQHFYFLVESTGAAKFSNIQISMKLYNSLNEIPQKRLKILDNGGINYVLKGNEVSLTFSPLHCPNCSNMILENVRVKYELIIGNTLFDVDSIGKCRMGYPRFMLKSLQYNIKENVTVLPIEKSRSLSDSSPISFDFLHTFESYEEKLLEQGFSHYFTVRATVSNYPEIVNKTIVQRLLPSFDMFYETIEVNFKDDGTNFQDQNALNQIREDNEKLESSNLNYKKLLIIALIVILVLGIALGIACYCDRLRKRRAGIIHFKLDESQEGRRFGEADTSSRMGIEMETKSFSSLKQNKEEDENNKSDG